MSLIQTTGGKDETNKHKQRKQDMSPPTNKTWALLQTTGGKDETNKHKQRTQEMSLIQTTGGKDKPKDCYL